MLSAPRVPKTLVAHRLMLLEQSTGDTKAVVDLFVQQRSEVKEERNKELDVFRAIHELTNSRAQGYTRQASQLQRVAKRSKPPEKPKGKEGKQTCTNTKSDTHDSLTSALVSAVISHTEQEAKTQEQMAKHYQHIGRLVKDRIDALSTIYKSCDDGAAVLHDAVRTVIREFETAQRNYLASSEQLQVAIRERSQLADNLIQGRVPPDEVEEAQEQLREKDFAVAQFQKRYDVNLESCTLAVASANAAVEKLDENLAELMSCTQLGEEGWKQAIINRLESARKTAASLPESNLAATVASLRDQLQLTKGVKSGGSGKDDGHEGATGAADGKKDASITLRHHFHVRHLPNDTSKASFDRFIGFNYDKNIGVLRSEQETRERHISGLAMDINALWSSGVMFKGNERCLISSDMLGLQRLLRRWKVAGSTHTDDDGQDNIGEKETEDQHEQQPSAAEGDTSPLQTSSSVTATAPPEGLGRGVASLKWMVNTYMEHVTQHVLRGNYLARLEAKNALLPKAPKAGSSSSQGQRPFIPFMGIVSPGDSENSGLDTLRQNFSQSQKEGEFESNEEGSGDGSESDGEQSNAASEPATPQHITGGETGDTVPTPTIEEVQEEGILFSCSIEKAERGFGFVFDWTDNAVRVKGVQPNGPASHMLSIGDKIIYANGKRLSDLDEAKKLFQAVPIGGKLELRYCRLEFQRVA